MKRKCAHCMKVLTKEESNENRIQYELKGVGTCYLCDECIDNYDEKRKEVLDQQESDLDSYDDDISKLPIQTEYECPDDYTPLKPLVSLDGCVVGQKVWFYCSDCEKEIPITLEPEELVEGWKDD